MKNTKKVTTKTATKTLAPVATTPVVRVDLGMTTYHYFRHWLKEVLKEAGVVSAKFEKSEGYNGNITVVKSELANAKKAVDNWQKENGYGYVTYPVVPVKK